MINEFLRRWRWKKMSLCAFICMVSVRVFTSRNDIRIIYNRKFAMCLMKFSCWCVYTRDHVTMICDFLDMVFTTSSICSAVVVAAFLNRWWNNLEELQWVMKLFAYNSFFAPIINIFITLHKVMSVVPLSFEQMS